MDISSVANTGNNGTGTQKAAKASSVDYDAFLKLLVAEMQNQDPTKPMESTEYIAQLASFSNVEQAIQTNEKLDRLLGASFIAGAGSLIGKTLETGDGKTSGEIAQVKLVNGTGTAVLASGQEIAIDGNVTISQ